MKQFLIVLTAAGTVFTGLASCQTKRNEATAARIGAYLSPFASTGNLTGAVLVARKGEILFDQAFGMANYEWQVPNSLKTRFHIASISKVFTAAAILQLQEQGRLQVSDSIARYLPDFPQGDRITLDSPRPHRSRDCRYCLWKRPATAANGILCDHAAICTRFLCGRVSIRAGLL